MCKLDSVAACLVPLYYATIVVVLPTLIQSQEGEQINIVDSRKLRRLRADRASLYISYKNRRSKVKTKIFAENAAKHYTRGYILSDQAKANPAILPISRLEALIQYKPRELQRPEAKLEPDSANLFVLTMPLYLKSQVFAPIRITDIPGKDIKQAYVGPRDCLKRDIAKLGKHATSYTSKLAQKLRIGIRFSKIVANKCYIYATAGTQFL